MPIGIPSKNVVRKILENMVGPEGPSFALKSFSFPWAQVGHISRMFPYGPISVLGPGTLE